MCQVGPELALAYELSQDFLQILSERKASELIQWLERAKESRIAELRSLAKSWQQDRAAIAASYSLPWKKAASGRADQSLQWLKRQMYGRARFDLLQLSVLLASERTLREDD